MRADNPTLPFSPFTFTDKSALEPVSREIGKMDGTEAAPARENGCPPLNDI
jgi:hypothetical protein